VLLIKRKNEPGAGLFCFPGGRPNLGETIGQAAKRECFEETGLNVKLANDRFAAFCSSDAIYWNDVGTPARTITFHYALHHVLAYIEHSCTMSVRAGDDALFAGWFCRGPTTGAFGAECPHIDMLAATGQLVANTREIFDIAARSWSVHGFATSES
jgi:ADP-ribose pyrophosphatase YjhB (NUDIX family)